MWIGMANSALEVITGGRTPWTLKNNIPDYARLKLDADYHSPDREWVERTLPPRDRLASVFFASTTHDENQPAHLKVADTSICATRCATEFGNPCTRFCPANVYEMVDDGQGGKRLQINAANCVHCKACDIKDPYEIITWTTPEGGSGRHDRLLCLIDFSPAFAAETTSDRCSALTTDCCRSGRQRRPSYSAYID